ncbi:MAG TPA: sulfotransferase [Caulobacteraceae bacterium]
MTAALEAGDLARAIAMAKSALADGLEVPLFYNLAAHDEDSQGRHPEAMALLGKAWKLAPRDTLIINAMGANLMKQAKAADAIRLHDIAIAIDPALPQSYYHKGQALASLSRLDDAREAYERAISLWPDYPDAHAGLAWVAQRQGRTQEAQALAGRALALDPGQDGAILVLAELENDSGESGQAETRIAQVLERSALSSQVRVNAIGLMGDALAHQGRAAEAFVAYTQANEELRRLYAPRFAGEDATSVLEMVESLIAYFGAADRAQWASSPPAPARGKDDASGHVFFVGFPRSGTTLLENVLGSHPGIATLDEREVLVDPSRELFANPATLGRLATLDAETADRWRADYWQKAAAWRPDLPGKVFIDKMPLNTVILGLIAKLFPDAKILFAVRDPRDVVLSCFRRRFGMNPATFQLLTLDGAARYYDAVMRLASIYRDLLPLDFHLVRYEGLVVDLKAEVEAVCGFIGVNWHDAMWEFAERSRARPIRTPSAKQVRRGLYTEGVDQWRPYTEQLTPVMPLLAPWIRKFGYVAD